MINVYSKAVHSPASRVRDVEPQIIRTVNTQRTTLLFFVVGLIIFKAV